MVIQTTPVSVEITRVIYHRNEGGSVTLTRVRVNIGVCKITVRLIQTILVTFQVTQVTVQVTLGWIRITLL